MGTSFDCDVVVSVHPESGKMKLAIGPFNMEELAELLDYLATPECRDKVFDSATKGFMSEDDDVMGTAKTDALLEQMTKNPPLPGAQETTRAILADLTKWRTENQRGFAGHIVVSVYDMRELDEQQQAHQNHGRFVKSKLQPGDSAWLWGVPIRLDDRAPGTWELKP